MNKRNEVVFLHLSDLHRTPAEHVSNAFLAGSILQDITYGFPSTSETLGEDEPSLPRPDEIDLVIVSGDLTQSAQRKEFDEAEEFLNTIATELLGGNVERLIVVPGNHDIDWALSRASYAPEQPDPAKLREAFNHESPYRVNTDPGDVVLSKRVRSDLYDRRFEEYSDFISRFYNKARTFPIKERTRQFMIFDDFAKILGIVVVAFSSCDLVDHLWRRGTIHPEAILNAAQELDRRGLGRAAAVRIAVWHHNVLGSPDHTDFMDPKIPLLLAHYGFSLGLHGHVHETGQLDLTGSNARIPLVWAGSLCAGAKVIPRAIPMLYNVVGLHVGRRTGWVHVRQRRNQLEAWDGYHSFGKQNRCWYPIDLSRTDQTKIYENAGDIEFLKDLRAVIERSSSLTLIGLGLNVLEAVGVRDLIVRRVRDGLLKATICFGNPYSHHVRSRLIEEERAESPPVVAAGGIINRIRVLLRQTAGVSGIEIKLFNNYPTLSILKFDDQYVYYAMGYRKLGNQCPALWVRRPSILSNFLDEMIQCYLADAVDAAEVFRVKGSSSFTKQFLAPQRIRAVGIYAVPERHSEFYEVGSRLLGFDVLTNTELDRPADADVSIEFFRRYVGVAKALGLHLTIADIMYIEDVQVPALLAELNEIVATTRPFRLRITGVAEHVVTSGSFVLTCSDESGELEKLHTEVAIRLRPVALGTNFTMDPGEDLRLDRMSVRDMTMIRSYQSPYVFAAFQPHFTLACPSGHTPDANRQKLRQILEKSFTRYLSGTKTVEISRLQVFMKSIDSEHWETRTTHPLGLAAS